VSRRGIIVGEDSAGFVELAVDSVVLPVDPGTRAVLITDPVTRAWLLTEAFALTRRTYLWAAREMTAERQHVQDARTDRERFLGDVREFLIAQLRDGQLDRERVNDFLQRHHQPPYKPRLRVAYTITGTFEIDGDHDPDDGRLDHLIAVDLDGITNADGGDQALTLLAGVTQHHAATVGGAAYRLGRDEMAVLWPDHTAADSDTLATTLLAALHQPVEVVLSSHSIDVRATASMGMAALTGRGAPPGPLLLDRANTALQIAKRTARGGAVLWQPDLPRLQRRRTVMSSVDEQGEPARGRNR
jgi:GGDEF domain-containing protein